MRRTPNKEFNVKISYSYTRIIELNCGYSAKFKEIHTGVACYKQQNREDDIIKTSTIS